MAMVLTWQQSPTRTSARLCDRLQQLAALLEHEYSPSGTHPQFDMLRVQAQPVPTDMRTIEPTFRPVAVDSLFPRRDLKHQAPPV